MMLDLAGVTEHGKAVCERVKHKNAGDQLAFQVTKLSKIRQSCWLLVAWRHWVHQCDAFTQKIGYFDGWYSYENLLIG